MNGTVPRAVAGGADAAGTAGVAGGRLVVLYDRNCGVCQLSARQLRRWDRAGRLELLPLQNAAASGRPRLEEIAMSHNLFAEMHVVDEATGEIAAGGRAVAEIVRRLPGGRLPGTLVRFPPLAWLLGVGYGMVARNRHAIGRALRLEQSCELSR